MPRPRCWPSRARPREDVVAALPGPLGVEDRVVVGGCLRQAGQHGGLLQGQLPDRLGEVDPRGGLDADRGGPVDRPVGGAVEVLAEDRALGEFLLVLQRQLRLLDLALEVALGVGDAEVAHQLHRDRRAALDDLAGLDVLHEGAQAALVVDPVMFEEALVLDRHGGVAEVGGDAVDGDRGARLFGGDVAEAFAVAGDQDRVAAAVDRFAVGERRRLRGDVDHPGSGGDRADRAGGDHAPDYECQLAAGAAAAPVTASISLRHREKGTSPLVPLSPACRRWSGCARSLPPASGWG
jgi:hypothetical protein